MFFGVYLCLGIIFVFISLIVFPKIKSRIRSYLLFSLAGILLGLLAFEGFSALLGIIHFGTPGFYSYPQDYFEQGLVGLMVALLPVLGILFPLILAVWFARFFPSTL